MMLTLLPINVAQAAPATLFGVGVMTGLLTALAISQKRWILGYLVGGMGYWIAIHALHHKLCQLFSISDWHGYVMALGLSWLPLFIWIGYRIWRYDSITTTNAYPTSTPPSCREHSPVYDDKFQPRFR
ncbi:hypothetical protein [Psychrobacter ciconiae]|uniref:hypothetical protein n=1 Tax=Psychrobacter ciconiae TaxID=1553449 RepID=UPI00191B27C1|nr:hypothetical protein [Psychrobacter ciconiae]